MTHLAFALLSACGSSEGAQNGGGADPDGSGGARAGGAGSSGSVGSAGGGSAGDPGEPTCTQDILLSGLQPSDPRIRETRSGLNGTFTDTCKDGDLVQYECGTSTVTGPPYDPATWTFGTGQVIEKNVDCGGRCENGACPNTCLAEGDTLRCLSVAADGHATFETLSGDWTYACDISPSRDCEAMPEPGATVAVSSSTILLLTSGDCVNEIGIAVDVGTQGRCWYHPCTPTAR